MSDEPNNEPTNEVLTKTVGEFVATNNITGIVAIIDGLRHQRDRLYTENKVHLHMIKKLSESLNNLTRPLTASGSRGEPKRSETKSESQPLSKPKPRRDGGTAIDIEL